MPRVPTIEPTQGRIGVASQNSAANALSAGRAVSGGLNQAAQLTLQFAQGKHEAAQRLRLAEEKSSLTTELGELELEADNDPTIVGTGDRFEENARERLEARIENIGAGAVADAVRIQGLRLISATGVSVRQKENKRFIANGIQTMEKLTDNYSLAAARASNPLVLEETETAFRGAIAQADFLSPDQKSTLNQKFDSGVSSARAINMLATNPDGLVDALQDPAAFPGLTVDTQARLLSQALSSADRNDRRANTAAGHEIRAAQRDNLRDVLARFVGGENPESIRSDVLSRTRDFNASGLNIIKTALSTNPVTIDDRNEVVLLEELVNEGDGSALAEIDKAYIARTIKLETRNRLISRNDKRNEPKSNPKRKAEADLRSGLGPRDFEIGDPRTKATIRMSLAIEELEIYFADNPGATSREIAQKTRDILRASPGGKSVSAFDVSTVPFGLPLDKSLREISSDEIRASNTAIGDALSSGSMSFERAAFLAKNNKRLMEAIQPLEEAARLKAEEDAK